MYSGGDAFGYAGKVNAHDERIRRGRGQSSQEIVVQRVDTREPRADEHLGMGGRNGQVLQRRRLTETTDSECTHLDLHQHGLQTYSWRQPQTLVGIVRGRRPPNRRFLPHADIVAVREVAGRIGKCSPSPG